MYTASPYRAHSSSSSSSVVSDVNSSASSNVSGRHSHSRPRYPHPHHHRLHATRPLPHKEVEREEEEEEVSFGTMRSPSHSGSSDRQGVATVVPLVELQDKGQSRMRRGQGLGPGVQERAKRERGDHAEDDSNGDDVMSTAVTAFLRFLPIFE